MQLRLKVTPVTGDEYEVETNLFVVVAWERKFKTKASELGKGIGMEDLAYLAYEATKAAGGAIPAVFDDFVRKTAAIEVVDSDEARPTQGEPTDAN